MTALAYRDADQVAFEFVMQPSELPLRSLSPAHVSRFTAWRGRSGKRYVASSFAVRDDEALSFADSVLIAVNAQREVVAVRDSGPWGLEAAVARWRDEVRAAGAVEVHVHLIAATPEDRRKVVADLTPRH